MAITPANTTRLEVDPAGIGPSRPPSPTPNGNQTDGDGDLIGDTDDVCPGTVLPDVIPEPEANRFAADTADAFVDAEGAPSGYTIADTGGCSCLAGMASARR